MSTTITTSHCPFCGKPFLAKKGKKYCSGRCRDRAAHQRARQPTRKETTAMPTVESKEASRYTNNGTPQEHCAICTYWQPSGTAEIGTCRIVSGTIKSGGWCRHFRHTHEAAQ